MYTIGAKGAWLDPRLKSTLEHYNREIQKQKIAMRLLFDHEVQKQTGISKYFEGAQYRFLPIKYSTKCSMDIFGDRVVILSNVEIQTFNENSTFTVTVNKQIADSFRTWFQFMWDQCKEVEVQKS